MREHLYINEKTAAGHPLLPFPVYFGINDRSRLWAYFVALMLTALLCAEFALEFDAQTALTL